MGDIRIALIGDFNASVIAHQAIPPALALTASSLPAAVSPVWIHTSTLARKEGLEALRSYHGVWCVPASPYFETEGVLAAIALARTERIPFLGTCGGFQHALMEYVRDIGERAALHAELNPNAENPLIARLSCSLIEVSGWIRLAPGSLAEKLYATNRVEEGYHCNFGLNPAWAPWLREREDFRIEGHDEAGDMRIFRLATHPFFMATLFQPERSSLKGMVHPLIREFVRVAAARR